MHNCLYIRLPFSALLLSLILFLTPLAASADSGSNAESPDETPPEVITDTAGFEGVFVDGNGMRWMECPFCGSTNTGDGDWCGEDGLYDPTVWDCYDCYNTWTYHETAPLIQIPDVLFPGWDGTLVPGEGYEWRGTGSIGSPQGSWYNPTTNTSWRPDLNHPAPIGPHWDYTDSNENHWRVYPDNRIELK